MTTSLFNQIESAKTIILLILSEIGTFPAIIKVYEWLKREGTQLFLVLICSSNSTSMSVLSSLGSLPSWAPAPAEYTQNSYTDSISSRSLVISAC
jgi:hypothetical protein